MAENYENSWREEIKKTKVKRGGFTFDEKNANIVREEAIKYIEEN